MRYTPDRGCPYQDAVSQIHAQAAMLGLTVSLGADQLWRVHDEHTLELQLITRSLGDLSEWLDAEIDAQH